MNNTVHVAWNKLTFDKYIHGVSWIIASALCALVNMVPRVIYIGYGPPYVLRICNTYYSTVGRSIVDI